MAFILIGPSGCGKSTLSKHLETHFKNDVVFHYSLDTCRLQFAGNVLAAKQPATEAEAYRIAFECAEDRKSEFSSFAQKEWRDALKADVVIVDTAEMRKKRSARTAELRAAGFTVWGVQVMVPLDVVIERQSTRGDKAVPEHIVRSMYMQQQEALPGDDVDFVLVVDGTKPNQQLLGEIHF